MKAHKDEVKMEFYAGVKGVMRGVIGHKKKAAVNAIDPPSAVATDLLRRMRGDLLAKNALDWIETDQLYGEAQAVATKLQMTDFETAPITAQDIDNTLNGVHTDGQLTDRQHDVAVAVLTQLVVVIAARESIREG